MSTKKKPAKPALADRPQNGVWIELDREPKGYSYTPEELLAFRHQQAKLANRMLARLAHGVPGTVTGTEQGMHFWWNEHRAMYSLTTSEAGTFTDLADGGYYFNLDHFGRA